MYDQLAKCTNTVQECGGFQPKLRDLLNDRRKRAEEELARVDELVSLLDKNPETERILQLLGQRGLLGVGLSAE